MLRRRAGEAADAVVDADESVAGEVDAEGDPQEGVGKGFVGELHFLLVQGWDWDGCR